MGPGPRKTGGRYKDMDALNTICLWLQPNYVQSNRNTCKGKDYASLFKLSNSVRVVHQNGDLREGHSETFLQDLRWVARQDLEQTRAIRRKARRAGLFPMNRVYQGPQSRTVCQSLTGPLLQGFLPKKEKDRMLYKVRQSWISSSPFSSKVSHAFQRDQTLGATQSLLVGWGMASCPWCWTVPLLKKYSQHVVYKQAASVSPGSSLEIQNRPHPRPTESEFATYQAPTWFACTFKSEAPFSRPVFPSCRLHPILESRN